MNQNNMPLESHRDRGRDRKEDTKRDIRKDRDDAKERDSKRRRKSSRKLDDADNDAKKKRSRKSDHRRRRVRSSSPSEESRKRKKSKHDRKGSSKDAPKAPKEKKDRKKSSSSQKAAKIVPSKLVDIGPAQGSPPAILLDPDIDYFAYHDHLRLHLYRNEGKYFEDLSSAETHKAFVKFCSKYNKGGLGRGFYLSELPQDAVEQCKRTKHSWNFKTSVAEMKSLNVIKSGVKKQTAYDIKPVVSTSVKGPMRFAPVNDGPGASESSVRAVIPPRNDELEARKLATSGSSGQEHERTSQQEAILKSMGLGLKPGQKIKIAPRESS